MTGRDDLLRRVEAIPYWYHRIELRDGVTTPGWAPLNPSAYQVPQDLEGQRVLDVGAWDGYWTFEALRRGAKEVVAIDDFSDFLGSLDSGQRHGWDSFDLCAAALGHDSKRCKRFEMSVYDVRPKSLGQFDTVFFFGTLYHLRHPLLALDRLSVVCQGDIYVESAVSDDYSPYRGGLNSGYPGSQMVMEFYPGKQYGSNETNWWCPTVTCMMGMVQAAGWSDVRGWKLAGKPTGLPQCRGFVKGSKG
jgi:tRNA (mo5U34)-methyltransferase